MTGMEHYQEAERLLLLADEVQHRSDSITILTHRLARAQAHATLALAMFATGQEDSHE